MATTFIHNDLGLTIKQSLLRTKRNKKKNKPLITITKCHHKKLHSLPNHSPSRFFMRLMEISVRKKS